MLCACAQYASPPQSQWGAYLRGASMSDMTADAKIAKMPIYLGAGGKTIPDPQSPVSYMQNLENELYDALRKPGISVQRFGTDVVVILVRDAIMELDAAKMSADGADTLGRIAKILKKYDATYLEIAGYTDAMRDTKSAKALSANMARRVGVYMAQHNINTERMFITGRGAARPIAGQDDVGRLTNRRVEILISPARR